MKTKKEKKKTKLNEYLEKLNSYPSLVIRLRCLCKLDENQNDDSKHECIKVYGIQNEFNETASHIIKL